MQEQNVTRLVMMVVATICLAAFIAIGWNKIDVIKNDITVSYQHKPHEF